MEIEHNRIVDNADGGLTNNDPDVTIDARHNWWGCNAGPDLDPGCAERSEPDPDGDEPSRVPYTPWMVLTLTATRRCRSTPADRSTLRASVDNLSDATTPAGPVLPDRVRRSSDRHRPARTSRRPSRSSTPT